MDLRKVKKLIELLEESELAEMEITEGDNTIRLSRGAVSQSASTTQIIASAQGQPTELQPVSHMPTVDSGPATVETNGNVVESPMVGTFFDAASPDTDPYVSIGSVVKPGDVLCIIEAMKTFNQLEADVSGTVKAIYKTSGEPVEFGEPLFLVV